MNIPESTIQRAKAIGEKIIKSNCTLTQINAATGVNIVSLISLRDFRKSNFQPRTLEKVENYLDKEINDPMKHWDVERLKILRNKNSIYMDDSKKKVMAAYKFPNGNVASFGYDGKQIPELQGVYSKELHEKIKQRSDSNTQWNGF